MITVTACCTLILDDFGFKKISVVLWVWFCLFVCLFVLAGTLFEHVFTCVLAPSFQFYRYVIVQSETFLIHVSIAQAHSTCKSCNQKRRTVEDVFCLFVCLFLILKELAFSKHVVSNR